MDHLDVGVACVPSAKGSDSLKCTHPGHPVVEVRVAVAVVPRQHHQQAGSVCNAQPHAADADVDPAVVERHLAEVQPPDVQSG